jgi:transcriptional regulator with XRE-family HTH domain
MSKSSSSKTTGPKKHTPLSCTGAELVEIRRSLGWTQEELASVLGLPHRAIQEWERGRKKRGHPIFEVLGRLGITRVKRGTMAGMSPPYLGFQKGNLEDSYVGVLFWDLVQEIQSTLSAAGLKEQLMILLRIMGAVSQLKNEFKLAGNKNPHLLRTALFAAAHEEGLSSVSRYVYDEVQDGDKAPNVVRRLRYRGEKRMQADWEQMTEPRIEEQFPGVEQKTVNGVLADVVRTLSVPSSVPSGYDAHKWIMAGETVHAALERRSLKGTAPTGFPVQHLAQLLVETLYHLDDKLP